MAIPVSGSARTIKVFRYDPSRPDEGHFDTFVLPISGEHATTILDVLLRIREERDSSLAFRHACRVSMCGSCAMVINGKERLACKTSVAELSPGKEITLRPLSHFPVIKDLIVDLEPFFSRFESAMAFYQPRDGASEPARILPASPERQAIGLAVECIACGCCVSSCTQCEQADFAGPAALTRSFSLLADSRDGAFAERLERAVASCYECRTEFNCTEVCPKGIGPTQAIKSLQWLAAKHGRGQRHAAPPAPPSALPANSPGRRQFLQQAAIGAVGASAVCLLGGTVARVALGPRAPERPKMWTRLATLESLPPNGVITLSASDENRSGPYVEKTVTPVLVSRNRQEIVCFKAECPHLGCRVRWDAAAASFRCACHGGTFDAEGRVTAGPPPRSLARYRHKIESGELLVEIG